MVGSTELSPGRSAGDMEGLSEEELQEEVIHDAHSNVMNIRDFQDRIKQIEAFEEDFRRLPMMNNEQKYQKQQMEGILCSLPLLTDRVTKLEENLGGLYQTFMDMEEHMKAIGELEKQSLQKLEMQLFTFLPDF